jgi:hypothetical protein
MILVKCTSYANTDDDGTPCILLTSELVRPVQSGTREGEDCEYEVLVWANNTRELLPDYPSADKKLGLVPYPCGTEPVLIVCKRDIYGVWARALYFFFYVYTNQHDVSNMIGKIYSVKVIEPEEE